MDPSTFILLVTGPSGAGKSSLLGPILDEDPRLAFSVSCTTRPPRAGERDGREYHFIQPEAFVAQREAGAFVEWAEVHAHLYGTRREDLRAMRERGQLPVLDVDVQGGVQILEHYGDEDVVSVFVFPPSWEALERRLRGRATDDEETVRRRLANARGEVAQAHHYRYWLVNDDLEAARGRLRAILTAEGLRRERLVEPPVRP